MSDEYFSKKQEKIDFKSIVLKHWQKILEITTSEFTGGYYNQTESGNTTNKVYVTDKRAEFNQAVESLALALFPHFDEQMKNGYQKYLKAEQELMDRYADADGFLRNSENIRRKQCYNIRMLEVSKRLFRNLSSLMYRLDYFKTASYSEGDLEEAEVMDVDGKEIHKTKEEKEEDE